MPTGGLADTMSPPSLSYSSGTTRLTVASRSSPVSRTASCSSEVFGSQKKVSFVYVFLFLVYVCQLIQHLRSWGIFLKSFFKSCICFTCSVAYWMRFLFSLWLRNRPPSARPRVSMNNRAPSWIMSVRYVTYTVNFAPAPMNLNWHRWQFLRGVKSLQFTCTILIVQ